MPLALKIGISYFDFWEYTIGELLLIVNSYVDKKEEDAKEQLAVSYNLADMASTFVGCVLSGKNIPTLNELYPETFAKELNEEEQEAKQMALLKEQMIDFANEANKQRLKGVN